MVRRDLSFAVAAIVLAALACTRDRPMADKVELAHPDSMIMAQPMSMDSLLDTMPGGEMVRGNDSAAARLLRKKM